VVNGVAKSVCALFAASVVMTAEESVTCPFCGQSFELIIDTSIAHQSFVTDCEVCCRPFEIVAECEPGEVLSVEVRG
jgi:hypothetical protein